MGRPLYELTDAGRASHARDKGRLHQPSCLEARLARARCRAVRTARLSRGIVPFTHLAREGRMTVTIGRRELIAALGGAAAAWPLAACAASAPHVPPTLDSRFALA